MRKLKRWWLEGKLAISVLWFNRLDNRSELNGNNRNLDYSNRMRGIAQLSGFIIMKSHKNLYNEIISLKNLTLAYKKARKGKTKKNYVKKFEENLAYNLKLLHDKLKNQIYKPKSLKTFILRDPKTRKISKSSFRDRIVHHALCSIIEPIFDKTFIHDNCANRKEKGTLFAIQRFDKFKRKVSNNNSRACFVLKADIRHYFQEVNHEILLNFIKKKIKDKKAILLIKLILNNFYNVKGMPLGNLTSQFFANVYLNELDYFAKHELKVKYYVRYVDDFVILCNLKSQLKIWKQEINKFLRDKLKLELHTDKSKIINLSRGIDFVGFRNFYYYKLLRKRNSRNIRREIDLFNERIINYEKFFGIFQGWNAYSMWANSYKLTSNLIREIDFRII